MELDRSDVLFLSVCSSCFWPHVWRGPFCFKQITRGNIRNDREWWDDWGCCHSIAPVFRGHHVKANKHILDGTDDDNLYSSSNLDLLPSRGRHVLWSYLK